MDTKKNIAIYLLSTPLPKLMLPQSGEFHSSIAKNDLAYLHLCGILVQLKKLPLN